MMHINDFYKHARAIQATRQEQERQAAELRQKQLKEAWDKAVAAIREKLPIEGAKLYPEVPGMTDEFPHHTCNYAFDLVLPGVAYTPVFDEERSMQGVIRCNLHYEYTWSVTLYYVWTNGSSQAFHTPEEAFLACCKEIGYVAER